MYVLNLPLIYVLAFVRCKLLLVLGILSLCCMYVSTTRVRLRKSRHENKAEAGFYF